MNQVQERLWSRNVGRMWGLLANDRGDVPGWVLITLMTAGLVVALWALAGPALGQVFNQAITRVVSF